MRLPRPRGWLLRDEFHPADRAVARFGSVHVGVHPAGVGHLGFGRGLGDFRRRLGFFEPCPTGRVVGDDGHRDAAEDDAEQYQGDRADVHLWLLKGKGAPMVRSMSASELHVVGLEAR